MAVSQHLLGRNIATRSNSQPLVTLLARRLEIHQVDPFETHKVQLIHSFPHTSDLLGIAEIEEGVFRRKLVPKRAKSN
jgi:hypothetical protein